MCQLFKNLLSNSLKYVRTGEPAKVLLVVGIKGNQQYSISINDNGIGFDEKHKERIFKPFERLHGVGSFEGTGMGLSICKKIVLHHEGSITAESVLGQGSTFVLTLPVRTG